MCIADIHTEGFQCWNTNRDILDQCEMFNGLSVYNGSDMYASEDSEWDDHYALASAAYVEDYNFEVPSPEPDSGWLRGSAGCGYGPCVSHSVMCHAEWMGCI